MKAQRPLALALSLVVVIATYAQVPEGIHNQAEYAAWKAQFITPGTPVQAHPGAHQVGARDAGDSCSCWVLPDASYTTIDNSTQWNASGFGNGDDGSFGPIALPFTFHFYGQDYDTAYININGNISFGGYLATYSSSAFPMSGPALVAPFWGDVDLRSVDTVVNKVRYKLTPTALYVNWTNVGYYSQQTDKLNSFQVIISDGTDPAIAGGNNVAFCYGPMEWTTGSASSGVNGFGGTPATVGANRGNGLHYIQLGRFDQAGDLYNGPFWNSNGVGWLTGRHFEFSTADETIPPIFTTTGCDTIEIGVGEPVELQMMVLPGMPNQTISASSQCAGINGYTETQQVSGNYLKITSTLTPTASEVGVQAITYTAQDNSVPPVVSTTIKYVSVSLTAGFHSPVTTSDPELWPNPAASSATLVWPKDQVPMRVDVIAANGSTVLVPSVPKGSDRMNLDLSGLPDGIYAVRMVDSKSIRTLKLVHGAGQ